ncbi:MAG: hypothetical protein IK134_06010 [Oscillospiraceae bacterium]|nr:hypothetical protein [Oscillospiraceae bacterium]
MKTTEYHPVKNVLLTALCWILQWAGGFFSALLMYAEMFSTFEVAIAGKLRSEVIKVHPVCFAAGAILSLALFALIWFLLLCRTYPFRRSEKRLWLYVWRLQAVIGLTGLFATQIFAKVWMTDCVVSLRSFPLPRTIRPAFAENHPVFYIAAAAILLLLGCDAIRRSTPSGFAQSHEQEK